MLPDISDLYVAYQDEIEQIPDWPEAMAMTRIERRIGRNLTKAEQERILQVERTEHPSNRRFIDRAGDRIPF